jgi:hypothetical protein
MRHIVKSFLLVERILRDRIRYFAAVREGEGLAGKIGRLITVIVLSLALFGGVIGLSGGDALQAGVAALKLPLVFIGAGLICLPTLYYFSLLFGSQVRFLQTVVLILTTQAVTATLTLGFTPISLLFLLSGADPLFLVALNIGMLGLAAVLGLIFIVQGALYLQEAQPPARINLLGWLGMFFRNHIRSLVVLAWMLIYGLVGAQLSWSAGPFFGVPLQGESFWGGLEYLLRTLLGLQ